ncbi:helix-turn-helix domain-containing protein [Saccharothrix sp. AJ9571]|nr:helix-turn-helix domain-containing protein [Saccharothrix sp. AJ9571]
MTESRLFHHEAEQSPLPGSRRYCEQLGEELRLYREHTGLTLETAAEHVAWNQAKLADTEAGTRRVGPAELEVLIGLYEIGRSEAKRLRGLRIRASKEALAVSVPARYHQFHNLQAAATFQYTYAPSLLPPIFQIEAYAAELAEPVATRNTQTVGELAKYHVRHSQWLLDRANPLHVHVVVGEAALYNLAGNRRTMLRQLDHLTRLAKTPHVTLQVLPFAETGHAVVDTGYTMLTGDQANAWLCMDNLIATACTDEPATVTEYQAAFSLLTTRSLNQQDSIGRLLAVRQSHFTASQRRKDIDTEVCRRLRTTFNLTLSELATAFDCTTDTISLHLGRYQPTEALAEPIPSDAS